jgi:hypothetical protein
MSNVKKWWAKPKAIIYALIAVLTLIGLVLDRAKNLKEFYDSMTGGKTYLRGIVIDAQDSSVEGAVLKFIELPNDSAITTSDGGFYFPKIPGKPGESARLYVYAKGHKPYNQDVTLPGPVHVKLGD